MPLLCFEGNVERVAKLKGDKMSNFNYGEIEINSRLFTGLYEQYILDKCMCLALVSKRTQQHVRFWEVQIIYRDKDQKSLCKCFSLDDYKVTIIKKGDMQIEI